MRKFSLFTVALLLLVFTVVPAFAQGTILDAAVGTPDLSTLVAAVQAADPSIAEALAGAGPLTVFAPTNQAFANLDSFLQRNYATDLAAVLENTEALSTILRYHVVAGEFFSSQFTDGAIVPSLIGNGIGVSIADDGTITLNGVADVVIPDINVSNGVVHVIDQVILPGGILQALEEAAAAAAEPEGFTPVRVAHLAGDTRSVDVYVNGNRILQGARYGEISDWLLVVSGATEVAVTNSGGAIDNAILGPVTLDLEPGIFTTIAATGLRSNGTFRATVITETYRQLVYNDGTTSVTVVHAIPDVPPVSVSASGATLFSGLNFEDTANAVVPSGTYDLAATITVAGADLNLIEAAGVTFEPLTYYTVFAYGTAADPRVAVTAIPARDAARLAAGLPIYREPESSDAGGDAGGETAAAGTLADVVIAATQGDPAEFTILLALVQGADPSILAALTGPDQLTVFAPTDAAFEALFGALGVDLETALTQVELVNGVLAYHVVPGAVAATDVIALDGQGVATLQGELIQVAASNDAVTLNGSANVITTDIQASNGIVHIIDAVLIPPSIAALLGL